MRGEQGGETLLGQQHGSLRILQHNSRRAGGYVGSNGTYAPPAFRIASMPASISTERSAQMATRVSGPTSCSRN